MIQRTVILVALLCSLSAALATDFATVMRQARQSERALEPQQMVGLVEAQGSAMQQALTRCTPRRSTVPDRFAVVFRINAEGRAVDSWTRNATGFEKCFAVTVRKIIHYVPPSAPFYTSIEYEGRQLSEQERTPTSD